jgi:F-type H+-transporting ATPase subunit b
VKAGRWRAGIIRLARLAQKWTVIALCGSACLVGRIARADIASESAKPAGPAAIDGPPETQGTPAAEEAPTINPKKLALQLVNFGVLLFILIKFGGPAIGKALAARHEHLKAELAAAAEARTAALARLEQQERRLAALEQDIIAIRNGVKQEAEAEKARLIALAEERARRIREETTFALDQQIKEAEVRLRREVGREAVDLAEQMVRRSMDARDQQRLVDAFVDSPVGGVDPTRSGN